jgi:hypothetical protein
MQATAETGAVHTSINSFLDSLVKRRQTAEVPTDLLTEIIKLQWQNAKYLKRRARSNYRRRLLPNQRKVQDKACYCKPYQLVDLCF